LSEKLETATSTFGAEPSARVNTGTALSSNVSFFVSETT
jgi:hypothetical protein